jgi:hypothetical protein
MPPLGVAAGPHPWQATSACRSMPPLGVAAGPHPTSFQKNRKIFEKAGRFSKKQEDFRKSRKIFKKAGRFSILSKKLKICFFEIYFIISSTF